MKIITCSGINGSFGGTNFGKAIVQLGVRFCDELAKSGTSASYSGRLGTDHFNSANNWATLLAAVGPGVFWNASSPLNAEAAAVGIVMANAVRSAVAAEQAEQLLFIAHSQGTNITAHALVDLATKSPQFFETHKVACVFLDPKLPTPTIERVFGPQWSGKISYLFLQSELDGLANQAIAGSRFIKQFPHGDHLFVAGLDHGTIHNWDALSQPALRWLTLPEHESYLRQVTKSRWDAQRRFGFNNWTNNHQDYVNRFKSSYPMFQGSLAPALLEFARGSLPAQYQS
jgi:hypothetical protein